MAYQKLQVGRALRVIPSDDTFIPFPAVSTTGTNTSLSTNQLVDSAATFVTKNIQIGDIIYNTTNSKAATVTKVVSNTTLTLSNDAFVGGAGASYIIYAGAQNTGQVNSCVLFVGGAGNVNVLTVGNDTVLFNNVAAGSFLPVYVLKVLATNTTATLINALW
jgi:hypothetical protein